MVDLEGVNKWYSDALLAHGRSSSAVGWRSEEQQTLRFDRLLSVMDSPRRLGGVLDYGCGYGSLLQYLHGRDLEFDEYVGVDISEQQLAEAERTALDLGRPATLLLTETPEVECDYVIISGTFNLRLDVEPSHWSNFVWDKLQQLWPLARKGLAVNFLTTYVDWENPDLFYARPDDFMSRALARLSPRVIVDHSYPLYEWSMGVLR